MTRRINAEQVAGEEARLFRQIIDRILMIHAATSESAIISAIRRVAGDPPDRAIDEGDHLRKH
jgi:hypothetical protein